MTATESSAGRLCTLMLLSLGAAGVAKAEAPDVPAGPFSQAQCVECHAVRDPALVVQWRAGPHGATADCVTCHGDHHGALPAARVDTACTSCHDGAVAHGYATSKHGVLVRIGQADRSKPLRRGEHRSPGCTYCHLHDRDHGDTMDASRGPEVREWVCGGCHAPRFVREQLDAGDRLTATADLKVEEAEQVAARHPEGSAALSELLERVRVHRSNVRLGAGHQSPDYQWWHGQPALDGDLIRIRDAVARALRETPDTGRIPAQDIGKRAEPGSPPAAVWR